MGSCSCLSNNGINSSIYVVWIDTKINNDNNSNYISQLKNEINNIEKLVTKDKVEDAIKYLKELFFDKTLIICGEELYPDFIKMFKENINIFLICPKIIILSKDKTKFISKNLDNKDLLIKHAFYNSGGVVDKFKDIDNIIKNDKGIIVYENINTKNSHSKYSTNSIPEFNFEYITNKNQLIFPLFSSFYFKKIENEKIIIFNKMCLSKYEKSKISPLFEQLLEVNDIPYVIICKYWIRAYTAECDFYKEMNKNLRSNITQKYLIYIQMMYEGVKLKYLSFDPEKYILTNKERQHNEDFILLYRGTYFSNEEIKKLENSFKNKKVTGGQGFKLPVSIVYNKSFFSFSANEKEAKVYITNVFLILKIKKDEHSSSCASIEEYSFYKDEAEILFFPFTCFEINKISKTNDKYHTVELNFLGKYENIFKGRSPKDLIKYVPQNSNFVRDIFASNIIDNEYKIRGLITKYKISKLDKKEIRIFGGKFVINNKDKCDLKYKEKKFELKEFFQVEDLDQEDKNNNKFEIELILTNGYVQNLSYMFDGCSSLLSVNDNFIFSDVEILSMDHLFYNCTSLTDLIFFQEWDISKVTDMSYLFFNCSSLKSIPLIENWDVSGVLNMTYMFYKCSLNQKLELFNWKISDETNTKDMETKTRNIIFKKEISKRPTFKATYD